MANPARFTYTATGAQPYINLDWFKIPFNVSATAILVGGATATFGVEYTVDDVTQINNAASNLNWLPVTGALAPGATASGTATIDFPVTAVRLNITAITGSVEFVVIQGISE